LVREYVVCRSDLGGIDPHIIAEVVRDDTAPDTDATLASALAGDRRLIVTRAELLDHPDGVRALEAWDAKDDSAFDNDCLMTRARARGPRRGLRLVKAAPAD
jgi:hypothetical protein